MPNLSLAISYIEIMEVFLKKVFHGNMSVIVRHGQGVYLVKVNIKNVSSLPSSTAALKLSWVTLFDKALLFGCAIHHLF